MSITPAQAEALARVVAEFDRANASNIARWGEPLRGLVAVVTGAHAGTPGWVARDVRTLHALRDAGLIDLTATVERGEALRRGSYGRWIGGTSRRTWVAFAARPTPAGRAALRRGRP